MIQKLESSHQECEETKICRRQVEAVFTLYCRNNGGQSAVECKSLHSVTHSLDTGFYILRLCVRVTAVSTKNKKGCRLGSECAAF